MLIEKNRTIARQRRQIGWLLLSILIGIVWIYSLKEDIEDLVHDTSMSKSIIEGKDKQISDLSKIIDSLNKKEPIVLEKQKEKPRMTQKKDTLKNKIDTNRVSRTLNDISIQKKDSL